MQYIVTKGYYWASKNCFDTQTSPMDYKAAATVIAKWIKDPANYKAIYVGEGFLARGFKPQVRWTNLGVVTVTGVAIIDMFSPEVTAYDRDLPMFLDSKARGELNYIEKAARNAMREVRQLLNV